MYLQIDTVRKEGGKCPTWEAADSDKTSREDGLEYERCCCCRFSCSGLVKFTAAAAAAAARAWFVSLQQMPMHVKPKARVPLRIPSMPRRPSNCKAHTCLAWGSHEQSWHWFHV